MMQLCRELFPTILETPGELKRIMEASFYPTKCLYYDIVDNELIYEFEKFIISKTKKKEEELVETNKTPFELMKEAGYKLTECKTEEDIQLFRKYYASGEELCTFDGGRLNTCYVFFAVKKDADNIKREDFEKPTRDDEYGTSVISIQFSRENYTLSIKNRYNHTVKNPDATFGNNLEKIIPGLTKSFEKYYDHKIKQSGNFEIIGYTEVDGKLYKYNYEINNTYYCPNNIIIVNGEVKTYEPEQYIIMDYFVLDLRNKTLTLFDENIKDGFVDEYRNIKDIQIKKENNKKIIIITTSNEKESIIIINDQNQIIGYENKTIKKIKSEFMGHNNTLNELKLDEVLEMENNCFDGINNLKQLSFPKLVKMGNNCFRGNRSIEKLNLPHLTFMGRSCFEKNRGLKELNMPFLIVMRSWCFNMNENIEMLNLPIIRRMGEYCFTHNKRIGKLSLPKLEIMANCCFTTNKNIKKLNILNLKLILGNCFSNAPLEEVKVNSMTRCNLNPKIENFTEKQKTLRLGENRFNLRT